VSALESIQCVAYTISDLLASQNAFVQFLSYRSVQERLVSKQQADFWHSLWYSLSITGLPVVSLIYPANVAPGALIGISNSFQPGRIDVYETS
jgi:hypothetical protein